ncbi:MAG: hypothetical protein AB7V32_11335 [Candidatus Berkiella sp.]
MNKSKLNLGTGLFLFGAGCGLILMLLRAMQVISFGEAHHVVTSGFEEESLYAMWKYLHGLPIYSDPHQIPFSASYFNWLFYGIYGSLIRLFMNIFNLNEVWIPTVGRIITLFVATLGFLINWRLFTTPKTNSPPLSGFLALPLSALLWFSPLIGFWAMTVRPDLIGILFDLCAAYFLLNFSRNTLKGVILASIFCYLSWACKQVNIVMPCAIGLLLLCERRWRSFITFSVILGCGYGATLLLANYNLIKTLFFINTAIPLSLDVFLANLTSFAKKALPAIILFLMVYAYVLSKKEMRKAVFHDEMARLSFCGIFAWGVILLPFSSKIGSSDNYHFIALLFMVLGIGAALKYWQFGKLLQSSLALCGMLFAFSVAVCFSKGTLSGIQKQHQENLALKACLANLEQPIFILNHYGALPWMNPSPLSFVLAYNYWQDRNNNRPFEHNGIGGLIGQGYFKTLVIPKQFTANFDGAPLNHYSLQDKACANFAVMSKKEEA